MYSYFFTIPHRSTDRSAPASCWMLVIVCKKYRTAVYVEVCLWSLIDWFISFLISNFWLSTEWRTRIIIISATYLPPFSTIVDRRVPFYVLVCLFIHHVEGSQAETLTWCRFCSKSRQLWNKAGSSCSLHPFLLDVHWKHRFVHRCLLRMATESYTATAALLFTLS